MRCWLTRLWLLRCIMWKPSQATSSVSTRELNNPDGRTQQTGSGYDWKANGVLDNTNRLTANLTSLDVQGTLNKVNQTLESAHQFTEKLNSNQAASDC